MKLTFILYPYSDYSLFSASKSFKEEDDDCFLPPARKSKPFGIQRILSTEYPCTDDGDANNRPVFNFFCFLFVKNLASLFIAMNLQRNRERKVRSLRISIVE